MNIKIGICAKIKTTGLLGSGYNFGKMSNWLSEHLYNVISSMDENYDFYFSNGDVALLSKYG